VVGEGLYNCSDLQLINGDTAPAQWFDKGAYLTAAQLGKVGEKALLRVFDTQGQEQIQHSLDINSSNITNHGWPLELANKINTLHGSPLQIGVLQNGVLYCRTRPQRTGFMSETPARS
jgi:predicted carbohydrate-binding protein with CBM5 and CBM33 domain